MTEHDNLSAHFACSVCAKPAGTIELRVVDGQWEVHRESFTSRLTSVPGDLTALRAALVTADARALLGLDLEYAPFYCPDCRASYCREHWRLRDVFDNGWHDSIHGTCPHGHTRMLED